MKTLAHAFLFICLNLMTTAAPAQIIDVRRAVKNKIVNKVNSNIDQAIDRQLNKIEQAIIDSLNKTYDPETAARKADSIAEAVSRENEAQEAAPAAVTVAQPALQTFSKFDFIPGEKVIFYEDFTQDAIGDFPALWNTNASGEIMTTDRFPGRWFQIKNYGMYVPDLDGDLPENFTVEFDLINLKSDDRPDTQLGFMILSADQRNSMEEGGIPGNGGTLVNITDNSTSTESWINGTFHMRGTGDCPMEPGIKYHIAVWVQKQRLRLYINEKKVIDMPRVMPTGITYNTLRFMQQGLSAPMITNFRVAAGQPDMRSKLITEGKLVTYGIYFDVNSDKVKPESYGTLKGIAAVLAENPDIKVTIYGHTDSDGNDAANLDLSKRRAASVKNELSRNFAIDASRMETDGKGESVPVAPNDTQTNKALNRRVEFVKL